MPAIPTGFHLSDAVAETSVLPAQTVVTQSGGRWIIHALSPEKVPGSIRLICFPIAR
jgi:hypothetical protein